MASASRPSRRRNYHKLKTNSRYTGYNEEGYYKNRYGKDVPLMLLGWLELGTKPRFKRKTVTKKNDIDSRGRNYKTRKRRMNTFKTGHITGDEFMRTTAREMDGRVTDELREKLLKAVARTSKIYGCETYGWI